MTALAAGDAALYEIFNAVRIAMILMAIVVAARRPDDRAARALVTFLALIGLTLQQRRRLATGAALSRLDRAAITVGNHQPLAGLALRLHLSVRLAARAAPLAAAAQSLVSAAQRRQRLGGDDQHRPTNAEPDLGAATTFFDWSPMAFFVAIAVAFWIAAVEFDRTRPATRVLGRRFDLCRLRRAGHRHDRSNSAYHYNPSWVPYLALTLIVIPVGLAYTILRHRTVDIGFVISRALVLTILSAIVVLAFGLLERLLGKLFIDASHIASRSVEIALALGLGFSLRSLHARIELIIDRLFFHHRQRALATLREFANDVYFITDPDVALERTVDVVFRCADAENAAIYLIADGVFGCAAIINSADLPTELSADDPLFVRLRATRVAQMPREVGSGFNAEIAFPMFVRATLVGALVLAAKRTGEAYDPEENALLTELAQRVGLALDALQTLAMRRELESLMGATGGAATAL